MEQRTSGMMGQPAACKIDSNERLPVNAFVGGLGEALIMGWKIGPSPSGHALFHPLDFPWVRGEVIHRSCG